jgi:hypothetical protein
MYQGLIQDGQVILPEPTDLPDGTEVGIIPVDHPESTEDDGPMTPEEIARTLAVLDRIQPFEMTDPERAMIEADRHHPALVKKVEITSLDARPVVNRHVDSPRAAPILS